MPDRIRHDGSLVLDQPADILDILIEADTQGGQQRIAECCADSLRHGMLGFTADVRDDQAQLTIADGAIVGTTFKKDGTFNNLVDVERVRAFMAKVRSIR